MAKYIGRLRAEERTQLTELISRGRRGSLRSDAGTNTAQSRYG